MYHIILKEKYQFKNRNKKKTKGQEYNEISLINHGQEVDRIYSIEIVLKKSGTINEKTQLMFGVTCMGRTPTKHSNALDTHSETGIFLITKQNENNFVIVGVLTWNIFMHYTHYKIEYDIVIKAFVGKISKPGKTISFERMVEIKNE